MSIFGHKNKRVYADFKTSTRLYNLFLFLRVSFDISLSIDIYAFLSFQTILLVSILRVPTSYLVLQIHYTLYILSISAGREIGFIFY